MKTTIFLLTTIVFLQQTYALEPLFAEPKCELRYNDLEFKKNALSPSSWNSSYRDSIWLEQSVNESVLTLPENREDSFIGLVSIYVDLQRGTVEISTDFGSGFKHIEVRTAFGSLRNYKGFDVKARKGTYTTGHSFTFNKKPWIFSKLGDVAQQYSVNCWSKSWYEDKDGNILNIEE